MLFHASTSRIHTEIRAVRSALASPASTTGEQTVLTGLLPDRSALSGVLAEVEALGLDLVELRQLAPRRRSSGSGDSR